uniref:Uncharacterized protein n=1 Tax=Anguilla anguilla TaxID=7936 RepID=A0A0E9SRC6_ANGAN
MTESYFNQYLNKIHVKHYCTGYRYVTLMPSEAASLEIKRSKCYSIVFTKFVSSSNFF